MGMTVADNPRTPGDGHDPAPRAQFAEDLRRLRENAGNPSFRRMASTSGSISHTTLHEAASGTRFPSWETTREFVRACAADEQEWRARWEAAKNGLSVETDSWNGRDVWPWILAGAGLVVLLVSAAATFYVIGRGDAVPEEPTGAAPLHPGDHSRFVGDVTIPDGTLVPERARVLKVWEIENIGSVPWRGRVLRRERLPPGPDDCWTPDEVAIGDTPPRGRVRVGVPVIAPEVPGTCMVTWKMVDDRGRQVFPAARPVYFTVKVGNDP